MRNVKAIRSTLVLWAGLWSSLQFSVGTVRAQSSIDTRVGALSTTMTCSPDKPIVWRRETINIRVWVGPTDNRRAFSWTATGGRITARADQAAWDFADVQPGTYTATVRVVGQAATAAECAVSVVVQPPSNIRGRESGWSFLLAGQAEDTDYGLYSYLLLGSPPGAESRERYRRAIEAYVGLVPDIKELERYIRRRELNVTYLPLTVSPPPGPVSLDWALDHYDYARARAFLSKLPGDYRDGPYFVSSSEPVTGATGPPSRYLFQDLSRIPPHLVTLWVKEFLNQAAQERFWEEPAAIGFALKLRTTVAILAVGLPDIRKALENAIVWRPGRP